MHEAARGGGPVVPGRGHRARDKAQPLERTRRLDADAAQAGRRRAAHPRVHPLLPRRRGRPPARALRRSRRHRLVHH